MRHGASPWTPKDNSNRKYNNKNNRNRKSSSNGKDRDVAQFSMNTSMVQRSAGSSAVAHVAYITGMRLSDLRTGQEADYTRRARPEFVAPAIVLPAGERETQSAHIQRDALWNMAEAAEKRKDANPARKVLVALPHELSQERRLALTQEYAQWLADRYGVAVDYAIHRPDKEGDQRNFHAHLVLTARQITNGRLGEKSQLEWKGAKLKEAGLPSGIAMIHELRARWETIQNEHLKRYVPEVEPVSCQRLKAQRAAKLQEDESLQREGREAEAREARLKAIELERTPQQHVGPTATEMERRRNNPVMTERGDLRRQAQQEHRDIKGLVAQIRQQLARGIAWVEDLVKKARKKPEQSELLEQVAPDQAASNSSGPKRQEAPGRNAPPTPSEPPAPQPRPKPSREVEVFLGDHWRDFSTVPEAMRWLDREEARLSVLEYTVTAREMFEACPAEGGQGLTNAQCIQGAKREIAEFQNSAGWADWQIAGHRDERTFFKKMLGRPDEELESLQKQKADLAMAIEQRQGRLRGFEAQWAKEQAFWQKRADAKNEARFNRQREELNKLNRLRPDVLMECAYRDQERAQRRENPEQQREHGIKPKHKGHGMSR